MSEPKNPYKAKRAPQSTVPNRKAKDLLASSQLLGQLSALDRGGYARTHQAKGTAYGTGLHAAVASLLDSLGLGYELDVPVSPGSKLTADFLVGGRTAIFVGRRLPAAERRAAKASGKKCVTVEMSATRSDSSDSGLRVADLADERDGADPEEGRLQT
ncbi:MAG: hypothetical protein ACRD6W_03230, partial [Nitrososphaerales archaeon]